MDPTDSPGKVICYIDTTVKTILSSGPYLVPHPLQPVRRRIGDSHLDSQVLSPWDNLMSLRGPFYGIKQVTWLYLTPKHRKGQSCHGPGRKGELEILERDAHVNHTGISLFSFCCKLLLQSQPPPSTHGS